MHILELKTRKNGPKIVLVVRLAGTGVGSRHTCGVVYLYLGIMHVLDHKIDLLYIVMSELSVLCCLITFCINYSIHLMLFMHCSIKEQYMHE